MGVLFAAEPGPGRPSPLDQSTPLIPST